MNRHARPRGASCKAIDRPMRLAAPVTRITLPVMIAHRSRGGSAAVRSRLQHGSAADTSIRPVQEIAVMS